LWKVYGPLWYLAVHCGALQKCYGRLVGHSDALRCIAVQCGNVVEGLRQWTIAVHRSELWCDAYVVEGLRTIVVPCSALRCIAVHCIYVTEGLWATAVPCRALWYCAEILSKGCGPSRCIAVCYICCGRLTDCYGTLQCLTMHCGALRKRCRRLADDCGALWCGVYVVDNLRTVMVPCSALRCRAVRCIALQKR